MKKIILLLGIVCIIGSSALAVQSSGSSDNSTKIFTYSTNGVYTISTTNNYVTVIRFSKDEKIKNITLGDSTHWTATPSPQDSAVSYVLLQPQQGATQTNMIVQTQSHLYNFMVQNQVSGSGVVSYSFEK